MISSRRSRPNNELTCRAYRPNVASLDMEARTVEAVLATENPVSVFDWNSGSIREILLMEGAQLPEQVPLIDSHDRSSITKIAGSTRDFRIEGEKLLGRRHFRRGSLGDEGLELIRDGHLTDGSIGYMIEKFRLIPAGKTYKINGREFTATDQPLRVVTRWTLREDSLTPVGADVEAKVRQEPTMKLTKKQKEYIEARGFDPDELSDQQTKALMADMTRQQEPAPEPPANPPGDPQPPPPEPTDKAAIAAREARLAREAREKELARQAQIRDLAGDDIPPAVVEECIRNGDDPDTAGLVFLRTLRQNRPTVGSPAIHVPSNELSRAHLEAAVLLRAGYQDVAEKDYEEKTLDQAERFREMTFMDMFVRSLMIDRINLPHSTNEIIRAGLSSKTLPAILGNIANKTVSKGYNQVPATWRSWCGIGSVPNFQTQTRARFTDSGDLEEVQASGYVPHGTALDEKEQYSIATYAKQFAITRQDIINDDLGVFTRMPQKLGQRAAYLISKLVYTHLLANGNMDDSAALFVAAHSNLNTSSALALATLKTGLYKFRQQTDKAGQPIDLVPKILLVPPELEYTARALVEADLIVATGSTDAQAPDKNVVKGKATVEVETRLSNSSYSGYSATSWYLMGDPAIADTIEVGFLNGKQTPTVERFNLDPDVLGITYRVYIDAGAKSIDFRNMQLNQA